MKKKPADVAISIFECDACACAHLAIIARNGEVLFSAGFPPDVWAKLFRDVAEIEGKHAPKH